MPSPASGDRIIIDEGSPPASTPRCATMAGVLPYWLGGTTGPADPLHCPGGDADGPFRPNERSELGEDPAVLGMVARVGDRVDHLPAQRALLIDDERPAQRPAGHVVEDAVGLGHRSVRPEVGQDREREALLVGPHLVGEAGVDRDGEDLHVVVLERGQVLLHRAQLPLAHPGEGGGVEEHDDVPLATERREGHILVVLILQGEVGSGAPDRELTVGHGRSSWYGDCGRSEWRNVGRDPSMPNPQGLLEYGRDEVRRYVLDAWDAFLASAEKVDMSASSRLPGWRAHEICVHLGSWPDHRAMTGLIESARGRGPSKPVDVDEANAAVTKAHWDASRDEVLAALRRNRDEVADYLSDESQAELDGKPVVATVGRIPLL